MGRVPPDRFPQDLRVREVSEINRLDGFGLLPLVGLEAVEPVNEDVAAGNDDRREQFERGAIPLNRGVVLADPGVEFADELHLLDGQGDGAGGGLLEE